MTEPQLSAEIEKLVDEIMGRYGKLTYPHAVYGALAYKDAGFWKNMRETFIKTFATALEEQRAKYIEQVEMYFGSRNIGDKHLNIKKDVLSILNGKE